MVWSLERCAECEKRARAMNGRLIVTEVTKKQQRRDILQQRQQQLGYCVLGHTDPTILPPFYWTSILCSAVFQIKFRARTGRSFHLPTLGCKQELLARECARFFPQTQSKADNRAKSGLRSFRSVGNGVKRICAHCFSCW